MPIRAVHHGGTSILAVDYSDQQWMELKKEIRYAPLEWTLPCCNSQIVAKTSRAGLKFFAHKARGTCDWAPETEHHLALKRLAVAAARKNGWTAETEVAGTTPNHECWTADVMACRGNSRVAVEIQWSAQTNEELLARQERYARSGVRALWLIRSTMFPVSRDLPCACVRDTSSGRYDVFVPRSNWGKARKIDRASDWAYQLSAQSLLEAAFAGGLRWDFRLGEYLIYWIWAATTRCWKCKAWTSPVTNIELRVSEIPVWFGISVFPQDGNLLNRILPTKIRRENRIGQLKSRFSRTEGAAYMSNGCFSCGALQGRFFEHEYVNSETVRHTGNAVVDDQWLKLLKQNSPRHWRILGLPPLYDARHERDGGED